MPLRVSSSFHSLIMEECVAEVSVYLQLKDAAQLALKKMPSSEQEALSMVCSAYLLQSLQ
jgi:hypothetical protein